MIQPRTPPGTLELLPREQLAFQNMLDTIRDGFERYGFLPIETPVFEYSEVLLTKSGGETEKQVYFVQSTGSLDAGKRPELALRFDLTVPLARYVAQYENQLVFPFRRYQMQRVYRGERNQKGRYREFYQCDIDVVGKDTLPIAYDAEMIMMISQVFTALEFGSFTIRINNRKLLNGLLEWLGVSTSDKRAEVLREIDKLEKVGAAQVQLALTSAELGLEPQNVARLMDFLQLARSPESTNSSVIAALRGLGISNALFARGIDELTEVLSAVDALIAGAVMSDVEQARLKIDLSIARGLDYYTGTIYETVLDQYPGIGSVCSGGRYEDLAGLYTKSKLPGVGVSIGLTRLFYQLKEAGLLKPVESPCAVYVSITDPELASVCRATATMLRVNGINTELAPEPGKLKQQLRYAERVGIRFVVIYAQQERERGCFALKDLRTNTQTDVPRGPDVDSDNRLVRTIRAALAAAPG